MEAALPEEIEIGRSPAWRETQGFGSSLPPTLHRCPEEVWKRTSLRARLFLLEGCDLLLRACVGGYPGCLETGLKVHPKSVVWEISHGGESSNLTDPRQSQLREHTLPSPVFVKAVIPLYASADNGTIIKLGALVVDAGASGEPIQERDFHYLQVVASLMAETLWSFRLMGRIRAKEMEKKQNGPRGLTHLPKPTHRDRRIREKARKRPLVSRGKKVGRDHPRGGGNSRTGIRGLEWRPIGGTSLMKGNDPRDNSLLGQCPTVLGRWISPSVVVWPSRP